MSKLANITGFKHSGAPKRAILRPVSKPFDSGGLNTQQIATGGDPIPSSKPSPSTPGRLKQVLPRPANTKTLPSKTRVKKISLPIKNTPIEPTTKGFRDIKSKNSASKNSVEKHTNPIAKTAIKKPSRQTKHEPIPKRSPVPTPKTLPSKTKSAGKISVHAIETATKNLGSHASRPEQPAKSQLQIVKKPGQSPNIEAPGSKKTKNPTPEVIKISNPSDPAKPTMPHEKRTPGQIQLRNQVATEMPNSQPPEALTIKASSPTAKTSTNDIGTVVSDRENKISDPIPENTIQNIKTGSVDKVQPVLLPQTPEPVLDVATRKHYAQNEAQRSTPILLPRPAPMVATDDHSNTSPAQRNTPVPLSTSDLTPPQININIGRIIIEPATVKPAQTAQKRPTQSRRLSRSHTIPFNAIGRN